MEDLVTRLRKRAEIRRTLVQKGVRKRERDRIADILEEAADEIEKLRIFQGIITGNEPPC